MRYRHISRRQRAAEYKRAKESFTDALGKAVHLNNLRKVPIVCCEQCNSEVVRARQGQREITLCLKCGAIVNPSETIQEAVNE